MNSIKKTKSFFNDSKKLLLVLLLLGILFFLFKIPFLNHYPMWDESVYLGMGKYIYSSGASGLWEMIRPLGLPVITGFFWSIGLDQMIVARAFSVIISIGIILTIFFIAKELFSKRYAILSALIVAFTPIFFFYSDYVMTDHISTLFLSLAILFFLKDKFYLGAIFSGIAFWFKFTHILLIGAIILYYAYMHIIKHKISKPYLQAIKKFLRIDFQDKTLKKCVLSFLIIMLFIGAYFATNYILYNDKFDYSSDAMLKPYLDASGYSNNPYQNVYFSDFESFLYYLFYYPFNLIFHSAYGFFAYLFFVVYLFNIHKFVNIKNTKSIKNFNETSTKHVLFGIIFFTYLVYFSIIPYKNERFWVFFIPFLAIYSAYGIITSYEYTKHKFSRLKIIKILFSIIVIVLFLISGYKIMQFYKWIDANEKPNLDIERYFDSKNINGPILTTDPRFTTYSNERYVGTYDILNKNGLYVNDWESKENFSAVIYNDKSIPCLENDERCKQNVENLVAFIESNFTKIDTFYYHWANISFYVKKN